LQAPPLRQPGKFPPILEFMKGAILFILLGRSLTAQQSGIEGVVVDSVTHQPMPRVHITLRPATAEGAGPEDIYGAMSRADGHFSISGMKPVVYGVTAQRNGYLLLSDRASGTVTLKPGETLSDFRIEMTPHAVVTGHVFDENGDPVQRARVEASAAGQGLVRLDSNSAGQRNR